MIEKKISQAVLQWFTHSGRKHLPWQQHITPYRVWLSEIMLQQTQVTTVIPYYHRFLKAFPSLKALAKAPLDEVLLLWAGLGYYARARNLHKTAQLIMQQYAGVFPRELDTVQSLPGIGRSTAGAILAISHNLPYAILDANVKRILTRVFLIAGYPGQSSINKMLWALSEAITPIKNVANFTQAIMDLGATVCTRQSPRCMECPISSYCKAYQTHAVDKYPFKKPVKIKPTKKIRALFIFNKKNEILLMQRPLQGIWGGLWSVPECYVNINASDWTFKNLKLKLNGTAQEKAFRHTFTHYHLDIYPWYAHTIKNSTRLPAGFQWCSWDKSLTVGVPAPIQKLLYHRANSQKEITNAKSLLPTT